MGGLLIDLCVLAAIGLFAWAGGLLGGVASLARTICALVAFGVAALMCDLAGNVVGAITGLSDETARIIGAILCGAIVWVATAALIRWVLARRAARRVDDEFGVELPEPLERRSVALVSGGLFGIGWVTLFLAMLVLLPGDNFITRSAIASNSGGVLIRQEGLLKWLDEHFPHYTQTLPKGELGAVVGEQGDIPMSGKGESTPVPADADVLLRSVNALRRNKDLTTVEPDQELAIIAQRQASALAQDHRLSKQIAGGSTLNAQVSASLGGDVDLYEAKPGVLVAWAHTPGNAMRGLTSKPSSNHTLFNPKWSGVGIGAADAGWFNGRIYVIVFVAAKASSTDGSDVAADENPVI